MMYKSKFKDSVQSDLIKIAFEDYLVVSIPLDSSSDYTVVGLWGALQIDES